VIFVGIDDTDMPDTPGTNQLARKLAAALAGAYQTLRIVRHQLCGDPSIPCTSKNGSASIWLEPAASHDRESLCRTVRRVMLEGFVPGSDPGLCLAERVPPAISEFGRTVQRRVVTQAEARQLAREHQIHLEGLGGTEGGVIGALAAVGLAATLDDGRVVYLEHLQLDVCNDELTGVVEWRSVVDRGVCVREKNGNAVLSGKIDLGKKLRPNCRDGQVVLFVEPAAEGPAMWQALKLV
jgi:hypothetical protein